MLGSCYLSYVIPIYLMPVGNAVGSLGMPTFKSYRGAHLLWCALTGVSTLEYMHVSRKNMGTR